LAVEADGGSVFGDRSYEHSLRLPDVFPGGEFTITAGAALNLNTRLGEMQRIAFVVFLATSVTNLTGVVLRVQLESTTAPKVQLNTGGMFLAWNIQTTTTWCRVENLSAGSVIVQYIIGGYR
jgi:hypothetical protein